LILDSKDVLFDCSRYGNSFIKKLLLFLLLLVPLGAIGLTTLFLDQYKAINIKIAFIAPALLSVVLFLNLLNNLW